MFKFIKNQTERVILHSVKKVARQELIEFFKRLEVAASKATHVKGRRYEDRGASYVLNDSGRCQVTQFMRASYSQSFECDQGLIENAFTCVSEEANKAIDLIEDNRLRFDVRRRFSSYLQEYLMKIDAKVDNFLCDQVIRPAGVPKGSRHYNFTHLSWGVLFDKYKTVVFTPRHQWQDHSRLVFNPTVIKQADYCMQNGTQYMDGRHTMAETYAKTAAMLLDARIV